MEVKMEVLGWATGEGLPKILCWMRRENWLIPENAARGRCVLGTEVRGGITHRQQETGKAQFRQSQEKWGHGRACIHQWGTGQKSLQRAEIPAENRNPCTHESQCWAGQTVVAENLFSDGKTILGVRNACRNEHRIAADSFPSLAELNYSWKPGKIPAGFRCSNFWAGQT